MILDRLVLKNFKRFSHAEIHFRDGITGILGNNGTGKSSLVQAVFFALYGVQATGISADYIVSSFASPKEKCEVRLDFRIGGDTYTVLRTFKKGKSVTHDATFHKNGKLMATGVSQVETEVKRTIGMGPVDFKNTIYAGQKDLLTLLENTPGKRKEWFLRALGIDFLKSESEKILKDLIDEKTADLQRKEGELLAMTARQSEEEFAALEASVDRLLSSIAEHTKARDIQAARRAKLEAELKLLAEKKTAYARLVQKQQTLERERDADSARAKNLEASLALVADEEAEYHRIEKTANTFPEIRKKLDILQQKKAEYLRLTGELGFASRVDCGPCCPGREAAGTDQGAGSGCRKKGRTRRKRAGRPWGCTGNSGGPARNGCQFPPCRDQPAHRDAICPAEALQRGTGEDPR